ncbi:hypothetical protein MUP56_00610 [Patescibacteria group bacterium]|nr:hypothetical protein [Patescibacteria group bacterium]
MTKKKILIIAGILIGCISVSIILFFNRQRIFSQKKVQKTTEVSASPTPKEEVVTWDDPAGFSFQYPKGLSVDKHDEDQENYAHIELTSADHKGRVIVWAKDTTATTIAQWLKSEKSLKEATSIDTTLGGNEAKKVIIKEPKKKQITATLDEDIVVIVETELDDEEFWQRANETIVGSFSFSTSKKDESAGGSGSAANDQPPAEADEEESIE